MYTLEIFNHYGINQARVGERFYLLGQIYENKESKENYIIMSFWNNNEQSFSLMKRDCKQDVLDRLRVLMMKAKETDNESARLVIERVLDEVSTKYAEIGKKEVVKHTANYMKKDGSKSTESISFIANPVDILTQISNNKQKLSDIMETECGLNFYCLEVPNCGQMYENNRVKKVLNYATIITLAENNEIIAFLPTEKIKFNEKNREKDMDER